MPIESPQMYHTCYTTQNALEGRREAVKAKNGHSTITTIYEKIKIDDIMEKNNEKLRPIECNMDISWLIGKKCRGRNHNSSN